MNEPFATHIRDYGLPRETVLCTPEMAEALRGRLPDGLIAMWQEVGVGIVGDGRFQFCLPDYLQPIVDMIVGHDPNLSDGTLTPFGYSAFGTIYTWHSMLGSCNIDVLEKELVTRIRKTQTERDFLAKSDPDGQIMLDLCGIEDDCDSFDEDGEELFDRAVASLGPLQRGECYGYFPALGLGGARLLKYLRRIRALEHFAIIADLGEHRWFNVSRGTRTYERNVQR